jgi:hypothetical protein
MPLAWIVRKLSHASEKRAVRAILREYRETGALRKHLPPEVKTVCEERAWDTEHTSKLAAIASKPASLTNTHTKTATSELAVMERRDSRRLNLHGPHQAGRFAGSQKESSEASKAEQAPTTARSAVSLPSVELSSGLVNAPSIGHKTAKRFEKIGILNIDQFLEAEPALMVSKLNTGWITEALVLSWQDQARLVCEVPVLRGYEAQLLVAADCRSTGQLAGCEATELHAKIEQICDSRDGRQILQQVSHSPSLADVNKWIQLARQCQNPAFMRRSSRKKARPAKHSPRSG